MQKKTLTGNDLKAREDTLTSPPQRKVLYVSSFEAMDLNANGVKKGESVKHQTKNIVILLLNINIQIRPYNDFLPPKKLLYNKHNTRWKLENPPNSIRRFALVASV